MVQMVTDTGFTVVWYRDEPGTFKCTATSEAGQVASPASFRESSEGRCTAVFDGLQPDTAYAYQLLSGPSAPKYETRTAPARSLRSQVKQVAAGSDGADANPDHPSFRFLAFGDSGSGEKAQYALARLMAKQNAQLIVHTGDLIYPDGERADYKDKFYRPYAELIERVPFYPCPGNHDVRTDLADPMLDEFALPRNGPDGTTTERNYWFDFGDVRFISLDTNIYRDELLNVIAPWMDQVLAASDARWNICFFHHPVYSNAEYGPTRKLWNTIVPVMDKHGVQLVLNGHDHLYERTHPMRAGNIVKQGEGTVYVTTGAGGAELYPPNPEPMPEIVTTFHAKHSFTVVDVAWDELRLQQIDADGDVVDAFVIPHRDSLRRKESELSAPQPDEPIRNPSPVPAVTG